MAIYVLLESTNQHGETMQALIAKRTYEADGYSPRDYFIGDNKAERIGEVEITGHKFDLRDVYKTDD